MHTSLVRYTQCTRLLLMVDTTSYVVTKYMYIYMCIHTYMHTYNRCMNGGKTWATGDLGKC